MAKNQGGDGKGQSKFRTSEEDATDRRAGEVLFGQITGQPGNLTGLSGIGAERAARIRLMEEQRRYLLAEAFNNTLLHLTRFGKQLVPGYAGMRPRWTVSAHAAAEALLNLYFYGTAEEIVGQELLMGERVVAEVRRRFAGTCHLNGQVSDTPGQEQPWFEQALADARAFHEGRRARTAGRQALADNSAMPVPA